VSNAQHVIYDLIVIILSEDGSVELLNSSEFECWLTLKSSEFVGC